MSKYGNKNLDWFEAVVNKLGGIEGAESFLRGELVLTKPVRRWQEENGVITFTLPPTDGTTGEQWIERLEKKGFRVSDYGKEILRFDAFKPTTGIVYAVKVLKGELFSESDRITKTIRAKAKELKLLDLPAEAACLIRENFTDEELADMGLRWIVVMHEPIKVSDGGLKLLDVDRGADGPWLHSFFDNPDCRWHRDSGFAFAQGPVA
jgi:hypothetical protein